MAEAACCESACGSATPSATSWASTPHEGAAARPSSRWRRRAPACSSSGRAAPARSSSRPPCTAPRPAPAARSCGCTARRWPRAAGERALRPRARGLHRRGRASRGALRAGRRRDALPRRGGGDPAATQVKLLRVLQEREFERVGGNETLKVDVRIIAATNATSKSACAAGTVSRGPLLPAQRDPLDLPPLRDRRTDVPLAMASSCAATRQENGKRILGFSDEAMQRLLAWSWPGNVRELEHADRARGGPRARASASRSSSYPGRAGRLGALEGGQHRSGR
jgi:hypothetical protein